MSQTLQARNNSTYSFTAEADALMNTVAVAESGDSGCNGIEAEVPMFSVR